MSEYMDALGGVIDEVVGPAARAVDEEGRFPVEGVDALGRAGILGLPTAADMGGGGQGLRAAAEVVEALAGVCGSTAMVVLMHFAATAVIEAHGPAAARRRIGSGSHLTTLALSEVGSRSHFWAPEGTAIAAGGRIRLDAHKSWVTSAGYADSYVWSSRPVAGDGPMTLWLVPSRLEGLGQPGSFDGLGLRGNGSTPVDAKGVVVDRDAMLGSDGAGLDIGLTVALPWFLVLSGAFSVGLMCAVLAEAGHHLSATRLSHLDQSLIEQPLLRADLARMQVATDSARALLADTLGALESDRPDAMLRVLEIKAATAEASVEVTDLGMKVCGGAAFRKELGIERRFRDGRAARVMAPTTDALLDFIGRATGGLPLLDA
jgi:alkylation response protein AidB-like acyl-CoA dehydrogenase